MSLTFQMRFSRCFQVCHVTCNSCLLSTAYRTTHDWSFQCSYSATTLFVKLQDHILDPIHNSVWARCSRLAQPLPSKQHLRRTMLECYLLGESRSGPTSCLEILSLLAFSSDLLGMTSIPTAMSAISLWEPKLETQMSSSTHLHLFFQIHNLRQLV